MIKRRQLPAEERIPVIPGNIFLFRSCTGSMEYPGTENAIKEVLKILGVEAFMDPDQTCCAGYLLTCSGYLPEVALAATARNLALAERKGLDTYVFCNGCFGYNKELSHILLESSRNLKETNQLIGQFGYKYQGKTVIHHVQELYYRLRDRIMEHVIYPLKGLRVGAHYGCHYLGQLYGVIDDAELPTFHEEIVERLGGTPVFYKERKMCCGYAVGRGFTHKEVTVQPHLAKKLQSARDKGVELITTVCPGCNVALDREQPILVEKGWGEFNIPVIDLGQLIALCLGVPVEKLGFTANTIQMNEVLRKLGL